jgi:tRNA (guanine-N7-)-methyltransferase
MSHSENTPIIKDLSLKNISSPGNSSQVTSNQISIHPNLEQLVKKYTKFKYLKQTGTNHELCNLMVFLDTAQQQFPVVLDSGCGTGESSIALARLYPDKFIVGFDKSAHRLSKIKQNIPSNLLITQQRCEDVWSGIAERNIKCDTYLLYQNPWPKKKHIKRRWHAHPIFPTLLQISRSITMRTNWRIYALEFSIALATHNTPHKLTPLRPGTDYLSPFERKYVQSGHSIFEVVSV